MKNALVKRAHRVEAYDMIEQWLPLEEREEYFNGGLTTYITIEQAAQRLANLEAHAIHTGWQEGYAHGIDDPDKSDSENPYPNLDDEP